MFKLCILFCISVVGLDIQDDMGRHEVGFKDNTQKFPESDGNGCRMESHFLINKVSLLLVFQLHSSVRIFSSKTVDTFAFSICNKYQILMSWLIYKQRHVISNNVAF